MQWGVFYFVFVWIFFSVPAWGELSRDFTHHEVVELKDATFETQLINSLNRPMKDWLVLVYTKEDTNSAFLLDMFSDFSNEFNGKVNVGRIDGPENPKFVNKFHITTLPSVLLFHDETVTQYQDQWVAGLLKKFALGESDHVKTKQIVTVSNWKTVWSYYEKQVSSVALKSFQWVSQRPLYWCVAGLILCGVIGLLIFSCRKKRHDHIMKNEYHYFKDA